MAFLPLSSQQIFFYQSFEILMEKNLTIFIWNYAQRNHFVSNHLGFACIWSNYLYEFTVNFCEFSAPIFATLMYFAIRKVPERTASFKWGLETIKYLVEVRWKNQFFSLNIVVAVQIQWLNFFHFRYLWSLSFEKKMKKKKKNALL